MQALNLSYVSLRFKMTVEYDKTRCLKQFSYS